MASDLFSVQGYSGILKNIYLPNSAHWKSIGRNLFNNSLMTMSTFWEELFHGPSIHKSFKRS